MNAPTPNGFPTPVPFPARRRRSQSGNIRMPLAVAVAFVVGLIAAGVWLGPSSRAPQNPAVPDAPQALSAATLQVLERLPAPVELRFYAVLDPGTTPKSTTDFAQRVSHLLDAYVQAAGGRIKLSRHEGATEDAINAAAASQLKPFNLEAGGPCYLGLVLASGERKELLPLLVPEWEAALESDLTRALARLTTAPAGPTAPKPPAAQAMNSVRELIPDLANTSVENGTRLLRERALATFSDAAKETQARLETAQQHLLQAKNSGSAADQQAALEELKKIQTEQTEKLKAISAQLQEQIAALEYLKKP